MRAFRSSVLWWLLVTRQRKWVIASLLLSFAATGVSIVMAQITADIFDKAIGDGSEALMPLVGRLVAYATLDFLLLFTNLQVGARIEYQIEYDLRTRLYTQLQRAAPRDLDTVATGQMVTRSLSDLELLQLLLQIIPLLVGGVPILLGYTIYLSFVHFPLTMLTLSLFAVNGYLVNRIRPRLWGLAFLGLNQRAEVTTAIDEPVRGVRVVKALGGEDRERSRVREATAKAYEFVLTRARVEARYDLLLRAAPTFVRAGLLFFGARAVVGGDVSLGKFVIFYTFTVEGTYIAQWLDELVAMWQLAKTGAGRITQLLAIAPQLAPEHGSALPEGSTGLELRRVGFGYGATTVVSDLDLAVRPGGLTVLAGGPGSGKSTVAALAAGLLRPNEGDVVLDGVDIATIDASSLRQAVHVVAEEPFLFARSVRENLTIGALAGALDADASVDDDALWDALRIAAADDVVAALPGGLDEPLGDRGMTLSGGQRQRLALARALVKPPRVLVLDDALAAVNPSLEIEILRSIRQHAPNTAVLCITRRPGPRALAEIVVELPAAGSHRQLAAPGENGALVLSPGFAAMVSAQPYDARLLNIIAGIELSGDEPAMPEHVATRWDQAPGLRNMLLPLKRLVVAAVAALLLITVAGLIPEFAFGEAADFIRVGNTAATDKLALGLVAVAVAVGVGQYAFRIVSSKVNQSVLYGLRRRVFERLSRLGIEYYDRELPGYVSARVVHDVDVISRFLGTGFGEPGFFQLVSSVALFIGAMGIITWLSADVALVVLPLVVIVFLVTAGQIRIADRAYAAARRRLGDVVARLQEDFAGRYVIRAFGAERRAQFDFELAGLHLRTARRWSTTVTNGYIAIIQYVLALGAAAVYARAGSLALAGALTVGTVLTLRLYLDSAIRPIRLLGRVWQDYVRARVSFRQLRMPFDVPIVPVEREDSLSCPRLAGHIRFESVSFGYPGTGRPVVNGVDLDIPAGQAMAVVGFTGAGKSSIAKLLGRIYDPDGGRITMDGHDLRDLDLTSYRRRLGIVPQDAFVFRGTVASNIGYGRPGATRAEIEAAARAVGAYDTLAELEGDFEARVEEEGRNLTAAERQLIALARMWLLEPDVLVLDEATASLDAATEARVLDAVCSLGRTTLLITHRLPVAVRADAAVVIDGGRVVERGDHATLMAAGGAYASLWESTGQATLQTAGD